MRSSEVMQQTQTDPQSHLHSHVLTGKPGALHLKVYFMAEHKHARDLRAADTVLMVL